MLRKQGKKGVDSTALEQLLGGKDKVAQVVNEMTRSGQMEVDASDAMLHGRPIRLFEKPTVDYVPTRERCESKRGFPVWSKFLAGKGVVVPDSLAAIIRQAQILTDDFAPTFVKGDWVHEVYWDFATSYIRFTVNDKSDSPFHESFDFGPAIYNLR